MAFGQDLIISEVVDATLPSGLPKFVEITNLGGSSVDLSNFSLGNFNNGAATLGFDALVLSGTLAAGDSYVVSYENSDSPGMSTFFDVYGFDAENLSQGAFINGNDAIVLFQGAALAGDAGDGSGAPVQDIYGEVGVDGAGASWDYTDSYAHRNVGASASATFNAGEWTIAGADALQDPGGNDAIEEGLILANTTPGSFGPGSIPVPAAGALGMLVASLGVAGLGAFTVGRKNRR